MAMLGIKLVYQLDVPCVVIHKLLVPPSSNTWYCRLNLINGYLPPIENSIRLLLFINHTSARACLDKMDSPVFKFINQQVSHCVDANSLLQIFTLRRFDICIDLCIMIKPNS